MKTTHQLIRLSLVAAAASLALTACNRSPETSNAPTASTDTATTTATATPPTNTAAPGYETPSTAATASTSPGAMVANNPPAAVTPGTSKAPLTGFDKTFVTSAAEDGMFEVEVGKLAKDKASDPAVKDFGQKLVDDHGAANDKLRQIASSHDLALPSTLPADKQKEIDKLSKLSGAAFDKEFVQTVGMKDHKADIALFEKASRDAKSEDLREFAKSSLPTLHQHLSTATKLPAKRG